jgi:hypothetical protein
MPLSSSASCVRAWKRCSVLVSSVVLLCVGAAMPVCASVPPGTSVTASSADLKLNIEADGIPDTVTCSQLTDTFAVTSAESTKATISI